MEAVNITEEQKREQCLQRKRESQKKYYEEHKDEIKARRKIYLQANKDKIKEQRKHYNQTHNEEIKEKRKEYYEQHKIELQEKQKKYSETHKEAIKARTKEYNARPETYANKTENVICECGDKIVKYCLWKHKLTRGHILNMNKGKPDEVINEINRQVDELQEKYYRNKTITRIEYNEGIRKIRDNE